MKNNKTNKQSLIEWTWFIGLALGSLITTTILAYSVKILLNFFR